MRRQAVGGAWGQDMGWLVRFIPLSPAHTIKAVTPSPISQWLPRALRETHAIGRYKYVYAGRITSACTGLTPRCSVGDTEAAIRRNTHGTGITGSLRRTKRALVAQAAGVILLAQIDTRQAVMLEELLRACLYEQEALRRVLVRKGVLTK